MLNCETASFCVMPMMRSILLLYASSSLIVKLEQFVKRGALYLRWLSAQLLQTLRRMFFLNPKCFSRLIRYGTVFIFGVIVRQCLSHSSLLLRVIPRYLQFGTISSGWLSIVIFGWMVGWLDGQIVVAYYHQLAFIYIEPHLITVYFVSDDIGQDVVCVFLQVGLFWYVFIYVEDE